MNWRNRWTFWSIVVIVLALISVPSFEWVEALRDYVRFASGWQPLPLKPTQTTFTPREAENESAEELKAFEFKHKAPKAKSVELVGDFNAWKPGLLKMKREGRLWSLIVPLPPGPHKYLFLEDGQPKLDPQAAAASGPEGRQVSLRIVK